jgi:hypothetical protein
MKLVTEEDKKNKDFLFRWMYITLGFYSTKYNYETKIFNPIIGREEYPIMEDSGRDAREAIKFVKEGGLVPPDLMTTNRKVQEHKTGEKILDFNEVKRLHEAMAEFEKLDLHDCKFYKDGKEIEIPKEVIDDFAFTGLMNQDFVLSDFLPSHGVDIWNGHS